VLARLKSSRAGSLILELLMLVLGINIALWFEGKFEDLQDARLEIQYLEGLRDDLKVDIGSLDRLITGNTAKIERLEQIVPQLASLAEAGPEQQAAALFEPSGYDFFQPADFTYRSMRESGDFRLLSDAVIKEQILRLIRQYRHIEVLQENFIQALDDEYIPLMMRGFDIAGMKITDPSLVDNQIFRNFFVFTLQDTSSRVAAYQAARDRAGGLLDEIEKRLTGG
jgi:hypothetical protein